jgi:hypothetical protein
MALLHILCGISTTFVVDEDVVWGSIWSITYAVTNSLFVNIFLCRKASRQFKKVNRQQPLKSGRRRNQDINF